MPKPMIDIDTLMRLIDLTKDDEINCEQCLSRIAEFTESELQGKSIGEGLKAVEHHLSICLECNEEYELLHRILKKLAD